MNNVTGFERAKSLIKSLVGKFPNNKEIQNLSYLPNEIQEVSEKNIQKLKILECPLICKMNDNSRYIIDLQMQNYYYDGIDLNSLTYGASLHKAYNLPVIIILLLFKDSEVFDIIPSNESVFKQIDDYVYLICFDLYYILNCMNNNIVPELNGFEISEEGKAWIKLLTIKQWMRKYAPTKRYALPKNLSNSKEIISAIMILNSEIDMNLMKKIKEEKLNDIVENNIRDSKYISIWINAFLKKEVMYISIVPFPIVAPEFFIRKCKKENLDKTLCKLFLDWLIKTKV